jgi:hypothetical protein
VILDALVLYALMIAGAELARWYTRRARRREWERSHPGLRWKDWDSQ